VLLTRCEFAAHSSCCLDWAPSAPQNAQSEDKASPTFRAYPNGAVHGELRHNHVCVTSQWRQGSASSPHHTTLRFAWKQASALTMR
jgi:hypothetical protein